MGKRKKEEWPELLTLQPNRKRLEELMATYARVVRNELPPHLRPEFQLKPEDLSRRIS